MNVSFFPKGMIRSAFVLLVITGTAGAGTWYVDVNGTADYRTIGAAVAAAQSGDTIVLMPGTYRGYNNTGIVIQDLTLTIRSSDPGDPAIVAATNIDCSAGGGSSAFAIVSLTATAEVTISGLTLGNGVSGYGGGALVCQQAHLTLVNCTLVSNSAAWWGGGLYCQDSQATVRGCTFKDNSCNNLGGGGICCRNGTLDVAHCDFEANSGSAIQVYESGLTLRQCAFTGNAGAKGGALYDYVSQASDQTALNVSECTFVKNRATQSGAALYAENVAATVNRCTFTANAADADGGAVYFLRAAATVSNGVFLSNSAAGTGGALFAWYQTTAQLTNCTLIANLADSGGAVTCQNTSTVVLGQCILWNNTANRGKNLYVARYDFGQSYFSEMDVSYSDVQGGSASVTTDAGCTLDWSQSNKNADPLFIGTFQDDFHLSPDSPCIDAGDPDFTPPAGAVDLDGYPRLYGAAVDMGAYEYQGLGPVYRFWSASLGEHFYTISGSERDKLVNQYAQVWRLEGIAYYAYFRPSETNLTPIYRFWSPTLGSHVWTATASEKAKLLADPKTWQYEGIVFYAYAVGKEPFGSVPVYRFWSGRLGSHFYTADETEKTKLLTQYANVWSYEGVAWYAFAHANELTPAGYEFTGGNKAAAYTMTLEAYIDGVKADLDQPDLTFVPRRTDAQMTIDFARLTTTLDALHVQTETLLTTLTLKQKPQQITLPVTLSIQGSFDALGQRGPFSIDPSTNLFANYLKAPQNLSGSQETFSYQGAATLGGRVVRFDDTVDALRFELDGTGAFQSLDLLPDGLNAFLPQTFQWQRSFVSDLLVAASVNGHTVQLYVTTLYAGTLDVWQGQVIK